MRSDDTASIKSSILVQKLEQNFMIMIRGGFRGGALTPLQGFDPLPTQRVPPLVLFKKSIFGLQTLKLF